MRLIIRYMMSREMTLRKFLLWLGVLPLVGVCWLILLIVYRIFEIVTYLSENVELLVPMIGA